MKRFGWEMKSLAGFWACALAASVVTNTSMAQTPSGPGGRLTIATLSVGTVFHVVASGLGKVVIGHSPMTLVVTPMASARSWVRQANDTGTPELGITQTGEVWR